MTRRTSPEEAARIMQEAGLMPLEDFTMVTAAWECQCIRCGRTYSTTLHRVKQGKGCPFCAGNRVDIQDVMNRMRAADLEPLEPYQKNSVKWRAIHTVCGSEVRVRYADIRNGQGGCTVCRYDKIAKVLRTPDERAAQIAKAAGGVPLEDFKNIHTPWSMRCSGCGNTTSPMLANVMRGQGICMQCRPKTPVVTETEALNYIAMKRLEPMEPYKSAQSRWLLRCQICEKADNYVYSWMKAQNYGCVYCSRHKVDPDEALLLFREMGFEPIGSYVNARQAIQVCCKACGRTSQKRYDDLRRGKGCRYCQTSALWLDKPAYFYVVENFDLGAIKVGIGNVGRKVDRITSHRRQGWECLFKHTFQTGEEAFIFEQLLLRWLRKELGLKSFLTRAHMPQGGFSETFDSGAISSLAIQRQFADLLMNIVE